MSILQEREKGWRGGEVIDPQRVRENLTPGPSSQNPGPRCSSLGPTSSPGIYSSWCTPGASALAYCLRGTWCKAGMGASLSLPQGLVKKSDMKLMSYLYCRSTLRHSEAAETTTARVGQTWEDTAGSPQPFALHLSKDRSRSLQKGMKAALAVLGTRQLPWCLTSALPLLALGRQRETVYYYSPRRTWKGYEETSKPWCSHALQGGSGPPLPLCDGGRQHPPCSAGTAWLKNQSQGKRNGQSPPPQTLESWHVPMGSAPPAPDCSKREKHLQSPLPCSPPRQVWTLQPLWNTTSRGQAGQEGVNHCPSLYLWSQLISGVCWHSELHYFWKENAKKKNKK